MVLTIIGFLVCAALIFFSGTRLAHFGDKIAEITGMGKAWFGLIMMASVTSLPELFVGVSSAGIVGSADLAVGDVLGSCVFNLAILSLLDALTREKNIFSVADQSHALAGSLGIILLSLVGIGIFIPWELAVTNWLGVISLLFISVYLIAMHLVYKYEKRHQASQPSQLAQENKDKRELKKTIIFYSVNALVVIAGALALPYFAEQISKHTGLGESFIGTLLLAASTSLPEVAVSIAAVRMGSPNMAVGNLVGSNLFNVFILAIDDVFYTKGHLLKDASENNIVSVFSTIIMTAIAITGLTYRANEKRFLLAWDTLLILVVYILNMFVLFKLSQ